MTDGQSFYNQWPQNYVRSTNGTTLFFVTSLIFLTYIGSGYTFPIKAIQGYLSLQQKVRPVTETITSTEKPVPIIPAAFPD